MGFYGRLMELLGRNKGISWISPLNMVNQWDFIVYRIPSGKRSQRNSPCFTGKLTSSMAIFNSELLVYQRVYPENHYDISDTTILNMICKVVY